MRLGDLDTLYGIESLLNTDIVQKSQEAAWLMSQVLHDIQESPTIDPETLPIVRQLREELAQVKSDRNTAVEDRATLAEFELSVCEQYCLGDREHGIQPCEWFRGDKCKLREWRVQQKEDNP